MCGHWFSINDIMEDPQVRPLGMKVNDEDFSINLFFFNHECENCGSTFTIPARDLMPLIDGDVPESVLTGSTKCEGHCLKLTDLDVCDQECAYAPFRKLLRDMLANRREPVEAE